MRSFPANMVWVTPGVRLGIKNRIVAMVMATVPSSMSPGNGIIWDHPGMVTKPSSIGTRNTQRNAVEANTTITDFSS